MPFRTHKCGELREEDIEKDVELVGWVHRRRDHGGLIFVDIRNSDGITQVVFNPEINNTIHAKAHTLKPEYLISVKGRVRKRPKGTENPRLRTGKIEVIAEDLHIINPSKPLPFLIEEEINIPEEIRLKYRYLDLRRSKVRKILEFRHKVTSKIREFLNKENFIEVETPILIRSTPEGARDHLIPSRLNPGKFYALPQSPQLFKQILVIGGIERYYQIARCFRDEDLRADRQLEFTQVDIELGFIESEEEVISLTERLLKYIYHETMGIELKIPFMRIKYDQIIQYYGIENTDLRFGLELIDLTDIFREKSHSFEVFKKILEEKDSKIKCINLKNKEPSRKDIEEFTSIISLYGLGGLIHFIVKSGKLYSPILKFLSADLITSLKERTQAEEGDVLLVVGGESSLVNKGLGELRLHLGRKYNLIDKEKINFFWIINHPLFEKDKEGNLTPKHHPFTAPLDKHIPLLYTSPESAYSKSYDIILNGVEIGGGSIRIHKRSLQERIFEILNIPKEKYISNFGFLLEALEYGAPMHGGIALGLDRLLKTMLNLPSIRDVIAFPKTHSGVCPLTGAPYKVDNSQLDQLYITSTFLNEK